MQLCMAHYLVPLLVLSLANLALSQEYLIPNSQFSCHTNTICFTLDQLTQTDLTNGVNLTLIFQPGEHTLTRLLNIHNFTYVQMIGHNAPVLTIHDRGWIELSAIYQLSIEGFKFVGNAQSHSLPLNRLSISNIPRVFISSCSFARLDIPHIEGSAIQLKSAVKAVIEDVVFESNNGTALSIIKTETVSIEKSTFSGNQGDNGGAIYIDSVNGTVTINNSKFKNNNGQRNGGAIFVARGKVSISHSVFKGNSADWGGGINVYSGNALIYNTSLMKNYAHNNGGGIYVNLGTVSIYNKTELMENNAAFGGGIYVYSGNASIYNTSLTKNYAHNNGGGIYVDLGTVSIYNKTELTENKATFGGGIFVSLGIVSIYNSSFTNSIAQYHGGGIYLLSGNTSLYSRTELKGNTADFGGGIYVNMGTVSIYNKTELTENNANLGGGIFVNLGSASIYNSSFTKNHASNEGGGIYLNSGNTFLYSRTELKGNTANFGGGIYVKSGNFTVSHSTLTGNWAVQYGGGMVVATDNVSICNSFIKYNGALIKGGAMYLFNSRVYFDGPTIMDNNYAGSSGGAIQAIQSAIYLNSEVKISNNTAKKYGGGVFLRESSLFVNFPATISHNTANEGGAIYGYQSTITFNNTGPGNMLSHNAAKHNGGCIYAAASFIKVFNSFTDINSNTAGANGGGFYLQQSSKLYIQKQKIESKNDLEVGLNVSKNKALFGGGIYVDDNTAGRGVCNSQQADFLGECFIQTIVFYVTGYIADNTVNTFITHNTADQLGSAIYGGLLDRCIVNPIVELRAGSSDIFLNGLEYIKKTVKLPEDEYSISSDPVQVKLCNSTSNVTSRKGQPFRLQIKALDQTGNPVNAKIHGAVVTKSGVGRLKEGQVEQNVNQECTELEYNVFSEDSSAQVELYAIGPCTNLGISKLLITVTFLNCTCPLGFHSTESSIECSCECDPQLQAIDCFSEEDTFQPGNLLWVGAADCTDTGYLVHDCPFDYCVDQPVNISLNSSKQINRQCSYNRSGVLCGECEEGLSLVFASSRCKECSNTYLLLLIPFAVAGIVLVVFILWLNITIATGTIYGLFYYANVLAVNKATFLPFKAPNFLTVFVSWVNLDVGIEICFYNGMNSQAKVLLQLAFPAYLFLLMFLITFLSKYVNSFAKLLSNRNPVAALCTLLVLSYSKLLRLIIAALQFTSLDCSDNSIVWFYDGNVQYFSPSHIPRFVAAAIILIACVLFTTLLFFGQWFPRCSKWKVMKWTQNTKYIGFMDVFHASFTPKHRYWPGLLLFALIAHNLAASMAPDTSVPVLSACCVTVGLISYRLLVNRVYKTKLNGALETLFLLNVSILAIGTATIKGNTEKQSLGYVSMVLAFILFVVITCYHFYKYVLHKTNVWNNQVRPLTPARRINSNCCINRNYQVTQIDDDDAELARVMDMFSYEQKPREETDPDKYITPPIIRPATRPDQLREPDLDILAPITEDDYRQASPISQAENNPRPVVTSTVVEIDFRR